MNCGEAAACLAARAAACLLAAGETATIALASGSLGMPGSEVRFLQSTHLQWLAHRMPAWKHSQYFLRQFDFLQLQPLLCEGNPP